MTRVVLENEYVRAEVDRRGGRVQHLIDLGSGRELLYQQQPAVRTSVDFVTASTGGWDALFPTDDPWNAHPDHGHVWSAQFEVVARPPGVLVLSTDVVDPAVWIDQTYKLLQSPRRGLRVETTIRAEADTGPFLWTAHPMLAVQEGWNVIVGPGADRFRPDVAYPGRFLRGEELDVRHRSILSQVPGPSAELCEIVYVEGASEAFVTSENGKSQTRVAWDSEALPYLWHTIITGALGIDDCVLIEPSTSPSTNLQTAIDVRGSRDMRSGQEMQFWTEVESLDRRRQLNLPHM